FVALLPLLVVLPGASRAGRRRLAGCSIALAALVGLHFLLFERGVQELAGGGGPLERVVKAFKAWPLFFEGAFGADRFGGSRAVAWVALVLTGIGVASRPRRFALPAALALFSPLPFAALGHNERYGYFGSGLLLVLFVAAAPRALALAPIALARGGWSA